MAGLTLRFVLGPFLRELIEAYRERSQLLPEQGELLTRIERLERQLVEVDTEVDHLKEGREIDRLLEEPTE